MADTYKILSQVVTIGTDETLVYVVPDTIQASISSIKILNSGASSATYDLSFIKAEDVALSTFSQNFQKAITGFTILPGEINEINGGITLSAGDQVRINTDSNDLIVNMFGVEI